MRKEGAVVLFLATLTSTWRPLTAVDRSVLCLLRSSCLLPCPFNPGPEVVIHWLHPPDASSSVHSFYHGADQLGRQLPRYRDRTALFHREIGEGNASLLLSGVQLEDRGRYKCYTSTVSGHNEDFITVGVEAVSGVSLEEDGSVLNCSSREVFPRPSVSWTPDLNHSLSVQESESGLFSVLSSVSITHNNKDYSCNISTGHSWRSATYRRTDKVAWSGSTTVLSCAETKEPMKNLEWTFNRTQRIAKWNETKKNYSLVLTDLTRDQQGLYRCELRTERSVFLTVTEVTVKEKTGASAGMITGVIIAVLVALAVFVGLFLWRHFKRKDKSLNKNNTRENEVKPLKDLSSTTPEEFHGPT